MNKRASTATVIVPARDEFITSVDFGLTLEQMVAAGRYDWWNAIIPRVFSVEGTGIKRFRNKVFAFDRDISTEEAAVEIARSCFLPGIPVHGLAFGSTFPDEQRKYQLVCPGSPAHVTEYAYYFLTLHREGRGGSRRCLNGSLRTWRQPWFEGWRFLGVQEIADPRP